MQELTFVVVAEAIQGVVGCWLRKIGKTNWYGVVRNVCVIVVAIS